MDERDEIIQSQLEELKRYKKIGPTPEQLMEIDLLYREKCKEVTRLTEHIHSLGDEIVRLREVISKMETTTQWIPCSERLPEKTGYYNVTRKEFFRTIQGYWISGEQRWQFFNSQTYIEDVIAWMPLPESWKGQVSE